MRLLFFTFLALTLVLSSCNKDEKLITETPEITPPPTVTEIDNTTAEFHQSIIGTQTALIETMVMIMKTAMVQPALHGLDGGDVVDTRSCPNTTLDDYTSGMDFSKDLNLFFNEDGTTCMVGGITYEGQLDVIFEAALGQTDAANPDIELSVVGSFIANGYDFSLPGGSIQLEQSAGFGYTFQIVGAPLAITKNNIETSFPVGTTGTFSITDLGEDPNSPDLWFDNPFEMSLDQTNVHCTNYNTFEESDLCTDTETSVQFDPQTDACPYGGILRIDDNSTCATPISNANASRFDFGGGNVGEVTELEKVIEFLSYEGTFVAADGPAQGMTSVDVGVEETNSTPATESLQRTGTGVTASEFMWAGPSANSPGSINTGQTINTGSTEPWINEFHYDNPGAENEYIEVAGPAGLDLSNYTIYLYNGKASQRKVYNTTALAGVIPDEGGSGSGTISFPFGSIQNGAPDGFALVKNNITTSLNFCN
ncbi:MAG TPA: hypothetical protein ENJ53_01585 [Phaeodactylibacter sp.]|nr:hypothetical protein [Phaeodactylibacter sp.]